MSVILRERMSRYYLGSDVEMMPLEEIIAMNKPRTTPFDPIGKLYEFVPKMSEQEFRDFWSSEVMSSYAENARLRKALEEIDSIYLSWNEHKLESDDALNQITEVVAKSMRREREK